MNMYQLKLFQMVRRANGVAAEPTSVLYMMDMYIRIMNYLMHGLFTFLVAFLTVHELA